MSFDVEAPSDRLKADSLVLGDVTVVPTRGAVSSIPRDAMPPALGTPTVWALDGDALIKAKAPTRALNADRMFSIMVFPRRWPDLAHRLFWQPLALRTIVE